MIDRIIKKYLGTKKMKREAIEEEIDENRNYIKLYKGKIVFYENEINKLESQLRKI